MYRVNKYGDKTPAA